MYAASVVLHQVRSFWDLPPSITTNYRPKPKLQAKVNPGGIRLLTQVRPQWESDKKVSPGFPKDRTIRGYCTITFQFRGAAIVLVKASPVASPISRLVSSQSLHPVRSAGGPDNSESSRVCANLCIRLRGQGHNGTRWGSEAVTPRWSAASPRIAVLHAESDHRRADL